MGRFPLGIPELEISRCRIKNLLQGAQKSLGEGKNYARLIAKNRKSPRNQAFQGNQPKSKGHIELTVNDLSKVNPMALTYQTNFKLIWKDLTRDTFKS